MKAFFQKINPMEWAVLALTLVFLLGTLGWFRASDPGAEVTFVETELDHRVVAPPRDPEAPGILPGEVLDLNTASAADLTRLPGIGEVRAAAIVAWREAHGPFRAPEDLVSVEGIGQKIWEGVEPYVTVGDPADREGGS